MMLIQQHGQGECILWRGERAEFTAEIATSLLFSQEEFAAIAALPIDGYVEFPQKGTERQEFYWAIDGYEIVGS